MSSDFWAFLYFQVPLNHFDKSCSVGRFGCSLFLQFWSVLIHCTASNENSWPLAFSTSQWHSSFSISCVCSQLSVCCNDTQLVDMKISDQDNRDCTYPQANLWYNFSNIPDNKFYGFLAMYNLLRQCITKVKKTYMNFTSAKPYEISKLVRSVSKG